MDSNTKAIAVIDSGVGGVSVWAEIVRQLPGESTLYYADTANCPYGPRTKEQIQELTHECVKQVMILGAKIIVLACNTMTAAAVSQLRKLYPQTDFIGMEPAVKPAAKLSRTGTIATLATRATLKGEIYRETLSGLPSRITVIEQSGDGLVELVEAQMQNSQQCLDLLTKYLTPMIERNADQLVLGCTHYPFLRESINKVTKGSLHIIDPAPAIASRVKQILTSRQILAPQTNPPTHRFISSAGDEQAALIRARALAYNVNGDV